MSERSAATPDDSHHRDDGFASLEAGRPMVRQIQDVLRQRILAGSLAAGDKLPSMRRLSLDFGCSLGIVKQAVNTLSAQGYLRSSPRRGVYVAEAMPSAREVLIVLPGLEIDRLHVALLGIRRGLTGSHLRLGLHAGTGGHAAADVIPDAGSTTGVAGVLLMLPGPAEHDHLVPYLRHRGIPAVIIDTSAAPRDIDVVAIDPTETARQGVRHLLDRGHRSFGVVASPDDPRLPPEMLEGVRATLRDAGIIEPPALAAVPPRGDDGRPRWERARAASAGMLAERPDITAVVGIGPQAALGAALGARDARRCVPEDLSVVGLLGDSSALQAHEPAVTVVDNPLDLVCEEAARLLLERVGGLGAPATVRAVKPTLVERGSVASRPS